MFKSDLNMDSLIIKANIIHDKQNLWHQENKVYVHIIRYFVLNNLEVDYMLHKNVVAKMSDITKFKLNLEHQQKEQNNIFQSFVFLESFVSCSNTVYIDFFLLDFQYLNDCIVLCHLHLLSISVGQYGHKTELL